MADLISGYNIVEKLGEGARSQVFQVVKPETGKVFALKRVTRDSHEDCRFLEQAIREHEISSRVNHPYLRKSYDLRRIRKLFRLVEVQAVMEYVNGVSLDKRRPEQMDQVVSLFLKVAEGLDHMHQCELLHTDIKPNNILITADSNVKIIDFGQSCPVGFRKPRIQGTPDYIAPEQVERRHLTHQTDVFNFGATLYWALTGETYPTVISKKGKQADEMLARRKPIPTPQDLNPEIPSALSRLVMESCAHDAGRRPRGMKDVIARLEMVQHVVTKRKQAGHDLSTSAKEASLVEPSPSESALGKSPTELDDSSDFSGFIAEVVRDEKEARKRNPGEAS